MTPLRELACATILAAAFGAQAQSPSGTPAAAPGATTPPAAVDPRKKPGPDPHPQVEAQTAAGAAPGGPKATADAAYRNAQKTCDAKAGADKDRCLSDARAAHDRAMGRKDSSAMPGPAASGTGAPANSKQK